MFGLLNWIKNKVSGSTITKKVLLSGIVLFITTLIGLSFIFEHSMQTLLSERESDNIKNHAHLAGEILKSSLDFLPGVTEDWAVWENTYEYVRGNFDEFLEYNLNEYPFQIFDLDFITLLDLDGNIIYEKFDPHARQTYDFDFSGIYAKLGPLTTNAIIDTKAKNLGVSGMLMQDKQLIYISAYPIMDEDRTGPCVGSLVFGRYIYEQDLAFLDPNLKIKFSIQNTSDLALSKEQKNALDQNTLLALANKEEVTAYKQFSDIFGSTTLVLSASGPRNIYKDSVQLIGAALIITALFCFIIFSFMLKLMSAIIVKPFGQLVNEVNDIGLESLNTLPVDKHKSREFVFLVDSFNNMLSRIKADRDAIEEKEEELFYHANYDLLTGLKNWISCGKLLNSEIESAQESLLHIGVYFLDLDKFKYINDTLGHSTGDMFIRLVAKRLEEHLDDAVIGRASGDKFIIIVGGFAEKHEVYLYSDKIMSVFETTFVLASQEVYITASVGSCTYPQDASDGESLIKNAEIAMYQAKKMGGNLCCRYESEFENMLQRKIYVENQMRGAILKDCAQFEIYYQPKVSMKTGDIFGCEALIRWITPEGMVMPDEFIPLAEESGLIVPLSRWILKEACRQSKLLEHQGINSTVSVNIPAQVLLHKDFVQMVKRAAEESNLDLHKLDIEITEATLINDAIKTNGILELLNDLGVTISIDDFGIGYSSLSYLKKLSVNRIKIDKSFIDNLCNDDEDKSIVNAIVAMAKSLRLLVTAEGVECEHQYSYLKDINCDEIQGYLVSKPLPFDQYLAFYQKWKLEKA